MKISIVGTGYVGLVSGACLADKGHTVMCVDVDEEKVKYINSGNAPIYEPGLQELLDNNIDKRLRASSDLHSAIMNSQLTMIAVGTPFSGQEIDLGYIRQVALEIGSVLKEKDSWHMVVVKSTVVPGTTEDVVLPLLEEASNKKAGSDFGLGMNPEFLREGDAISDFMNPDRIVIGGIDKASLDCLRELYTVFPGVDVLETNPRTSEMIKYTANSLLATMISFSNEIANLCTTTPDVDVTEVMAGVHMDKRLTPISEQGHRTIPNFTSYLEAGCGFGGSCFPKDVKALASYGQRMGQPMPMLNAVININEQQPERMISMLEEEIPGSIYGIKVAVLGLAFKPGSDDVRESPAIAVITKLLGKGAIIKTFDPIVSRIENLPFGAPELQSADSLENALDGVEAVLIMTRWQDFNRVPRLIRNSNPSTLLIDGRRMIDKKEVEHYRGIGLAKS